MELNVKVPLELIESDTPPLLFQAYPSGALGAPFKG